MSKSVNFFFDLSFISSFVYPNWFYIKQLFLNFLWSLSLFLVA
ncbi:hypothetical protein SAMN05660862_2144 [Sphingobacterium psychroaquaticum]|uniref:Uncharacterized protein n=1 Tax=Sphingobacterium psychroaquaticum TaxID=561061 RepID=A0A1X7JT14_9SPHI|nr:hypothetical protein SAMN05660862_2144 [Sphingobacterium psychroaquaticum]